MSEILTAEQIAELSITEANVYRLIASHEALRVELDALLQPPDVPCWKELVRLAYADDGDGALGINRITAEYNRMKASSNAATRLYTLASERADAATRKAFGEAAKCLLNWREADWTVGEMSDELRRRSGEGR